ncbi:MAG TPA: hypothetical protein VF432_15495 [Thermoanaerobaculia bacterium]
MKVLALSFLLFATSPMVFDTTKLADGASDVRLEGSRTVSVTRTGETVTVRVEEGKRVDTVTLTRKAGGEVTISHKDNGEPRRLLPLGRQPVVVDGIDLEPFMAGNFFGTQTMAAPREVPPPPARNERRPTYYVCPKDETMVRVRPGRGPAELFCPLDGTPMKAGTGSDKQIFLIQ